MVIVFMGNSNSSPGDSPIQTITKRGLIELIPLSRANGIGVFTLSILLAAIITVYLYRRVRRHLDENNKGVNVSDEENMVNNCPQKCWTSVFVQ